MKHLQSRALFAYWDRVRAGREAPERSEIEPASIRELLADMFILEVDEKACASYRLAGTRVCAARCCELRGSDFLDGWDEEDRATMATLLWSVVDEAAAATAVWTGSTAKGRDLSFETLLLPLLLNGQRSLRVLGSSAPFETPYWFGLNPIVSTKLASVHVLWPDGMSGLAVAAQATAAAEPVRIRHLAVYEGGRR